MVEELPAKRKSKSKAKAEADQTIPATTTVGYYLRERREARKLTLERISGVINVRVALLKALEEGDIKALPGMIYATGFVRTYANYMGLNGDDLARRFKAEHLPQGGGGPDLSLYPVPKSENRLPDPMILGGAGLAALLVIILWAIFSGGGETEQLAEAIPAAPAVEVGAMAAVEPTFPEETTDAAPAEAEEAILLPVTPVVSVREAEDEASSDDAQVQQKPAAVEEPVKVAVQEQSAKPLPVEEPSVMGAKSGSHVVLKAVQTTWIEVSDAKGHVVFKKVLKPGEQYNVPDTKGLSLVTSNAGGLAVHVDGKKVQDLGRPGDIVSGISLDPKSLSIERLRANKRSYRE